MIYFLFRLNIFYYYFILRSIYLFFAILFISFIFIYTTFSKLFSFLYLLFFNQIISISLSWINFLAFTISLPLLYSISLLFPHYFSLFTFISFFSFLSFLSSVPLTYARHTSRFLSIFCLTAPIALVGELGEKIIVELIVKLVLKLKRILKLGD